MNSLGSLVVLSITLAVVAASPTSRVVGGQNAELREFPYQVSLQFVDTEGVATHLCGGSILRDPISANSSRFVLTAAHCRLDLSKGHMHVVAGEHDFQLASGSEEVRLAVAIKYHEKYGQGGGPHDLAVVKVDSPFVFTDAIQPVDLPESGAVPEGEATVSGWGSMSTSPWPNYPEILQTAVLPIVNLDECRHQWSDFNMVYDENVCAGATDGSLAVCSGDSGGPLVQKSTTKTVQVGIVSWGAVPCGQFKRPGVFGRVSAYVDWIEGTIKRLL